MKRRATIRIRGDWQRDFCGAFGEGLRRHGWAVDIYDMVPLRVEQFGDLLVLWGTGSQTAIAGQRRRGGEIVILEQAPIGFPEYMSVSFGGELNGRAEFRGPFDDPSRWNKLFADRMQPWRARPGVALIAGQVPRDRAVRGLDMPSFYRSAADAFREAGYDVLFRPHPRAPERETFGLPASSEGTPLEEDLARAALAVTWNSNTGVDAVLAGVPTVAMDVGSMAWDVAGHELRPPPTPDRTAWAHATAWKCWSIDEMASGECWAVVGDGQLSQAA